jgi:hypothetical protein
LDMGDWRKGKKLQRYNEMLLKLVSIQQNFQKSAFFRQLWGIWNFAFFYMEKL